MANVKNFGLVGVGSAVQYGKGGASLSSQSATVLKADGTGAFMVPVGGTAARPTAATGMIRLNNDATPVMEYYNGAAWNTLATGGAAVTEVSVASQNGFAGTSSGGTTPTLTLTTSATGLLAGSAGSLVTAVSGTDIKTVGGLSLVGSGDAGTITVPYGGTGVTSFTNKGVLFGNNASAIQATAAGTQYQALVVNASGNPEFGAIDLAQATAVTGILGSANGGTGVDNGVNTITIAGNISTGGALTTAGELTTIGAFPTTFTMTASTAVTFPTSGTLLSTDSTYVSTIDFGTTGLTPNTATDGTVAVAGTLVAANGGTGVATFSAGNVLYASANNVWSTAAPGATSGVQAYDAGLDALAAKTTTGIMVQTGADTYSSVTLVAPAAGFTISNADGTGGNPTFALANDLAALEGLTTTGYIVRTADGTAATRSIAGTTGRVVVTNGDGVSSDTNIDLETVTNPGNGGSFVKVTTDAYGRVTNSTAVVTADITTLVDGTYVNVAGDTMTGNLNMGGTFTVTGLADPTASTDAANKNYVDNAVTGLTWKTAVLAATTSDITLSGEQTIDGIALVTGDRVLVKNQAIAANNGIFIVASGAWTRSADADTPSDLDGAAVFVQQGTVNADSGWVQTNTIVTVGSTSVVWAQFSGAGAYTGGVGIDITGNVISANLGAGIVELPSDEIGLDIVSGKAVQLTTTATGGQLTFVLDTGSGLEQSATGLKISADGVTNAMLVNDFITINGDAGTFAQSLGGTLILSGNTTQGISTDANTTPGTVAFTIADASSSQKGVAKFNATEFSVTGGDVTLGLVGVTKGGTGFSSYTVGDMLYADTTTSLAKLAAGTAGTVLKGGATPSYGAVDLTADVTGILPAANGGTGVSNSNTITLGGNISTAGAFTTSGAFATTFTMTGVTTLTLPESGTLATVGNTVASFSGGTTGLTPNSATTGAITLGGTLVVANGGTGVATLGANQLMIGNGTSPVLTSANLTFAAGVLAIGDTTGVTIDAAGGDVIIAAQDTNANINLVPNGTGAVIVGSTGNGVITAGPTESLTVTGATGLTLGSAAGDIVMSLAASTADKVTVTGPTAAQYATGLADSDLVNKYYVDQAATFTPGDVKAVQSVVDLSSAGTTNIGTILPAGVTILSVKVSVTAADTATGTLSVGKSGGVAAYMTAAENDTQSTGLYLAETYVDEAGAVQVIATVAGTPGGSGSAKVVVTYQIN